MGNTEFLLQNVRTCAIINYYNLNFSSLRGKAQNLKHYHFSFLILYTNHTIVYEMCCMICYHLYNLKSVKNTHGGVLACNFTKSDTPPWGFPRFFKLCKWHQIALRVWHWFSLLLVRWELYFGEYRIFYYRMFVCHK